MPSKLSQQRELDKLVTAYTWLQAIGTDISAIGQSKTLSNLKKQQTVGQNLINLGNVIQTIGNVALTQLAIAQTKYVENKSANNINVLSNLLQAIGTGLAVVGALESD